MVGGSTPNEKKFCFQTRKIRKEGRKERERAREKKTKEKQGQLVAWALLQPFSEDLYETLYEMLNVEDDGVTGTESNESQTSLKLGTIRASDALSVRNNKRLTTGNDFSLSFFFVVFKSCRVFLLLLLVDFFFEDCKRREGGRRSKGGRRINRRLVKEIWNIHSIRRPNRWPFVPCVAHSVDLLTGLLMMMKEQLWWWWWWQRWRRKRWKLLEWPGQL